MWCQHVEHLDGSSKFSDDEYFRILTVIIRIFHKTENEFILNCCPKSMHYSSYFRTRCIETAIWNVALSVRKTTKYTNEKYSASAW